MCVCVCVGLLLPLHFCCCMSVCVRAAAAALAGRPSAAPVGSIRHLGKINTGTKAARVSSGPRPGVPWHQWNLVVQV
ncbi:hypothetical protein COO60DRAFT_1489953, partial [Scenedesmus sp. NREL 46B-D3]